jgi:methionyl-tRNA formyltransferase
VVTAIREGDSVTGITLMKLDPGMDTGPIIAQRVYSISAEDTAETLTSALFALGASLLMENLRPWVEGRLAAQPQDETEATVTRKLERADGHAHWEHPASVLQRLQRAYTPWPGLFTYWRGQVLKLLDVVALPAPSTDNSGPGTVVELSSDETPVGIVTSDGVLGLRVVQLEGRRPNTAAEFVRGYPHFIGSWLSQTS